MKAKKKDITATEMTFKKDRLNALGS